jgi:hypothetical protein
MELVKLPLNLIWKNNLFHIHLYSLEEAKNLNMRKTLKINKPYINQWLVYLI